MRRRFAPRRRQVARLASCIFTLSLAAASAPAQAAPSPGKKVSGKGGNFGAGLSLGDPMGATIKWFMHPNHALQADFGWAPMHHGDGRLGADYLWHPASFVENSVMTFLPYIGLGVGMIFWSGHGRWGCGGYHGRGYRYDCDRRYYRSGGAAMMIRAPILGLGFHWKGAPVDTMLEGSWSPYVVLPDLAHGDVSVKVRYYF